MPKEPIARRFPPDFAPIIVAFRAAVGLGAAVSVLAEIADDVAKADVGMHTE
jgi:hypothetical protein